MKLKDLYSSYRRKKKTMLILLLVFGLYFFIYQFLSAFVLDKFQAKHTENNYLGHGEEPSGLSDAYNNSGVVRGSRILDEAKYTPDQDGMFMCTESKLKIPFSFVNDDYCDCPLDGSDEPGTNACDNGHFCCATQIRYPTGEFQCISSHKVNDGICDCCDGSDEWSGAILIDTVKKELQEKLNNFLTPCRNRCSIKK